MDDSFAGAAVQLAGLSARLLGWTPETFWNATPAELAACLGPAAAGSAPPSRADIAALIERDNDGQ